MVRAIVLYKDTPDDAWYRKHEELCRAVPGATFRHGRVFGAPMGEPEYAYYAEFEWPDMDAFKAGARSDEFMATGKDAMGHGSFTVLFSNVD
jgi:EthD domain-containing protein